MSFKFSKVRNIPKRFKVLIVVGALVIVLIIMRLLGLI